MLNPEAAGGGQGILPQLNSADDGVWTYSKALKDWSTSPNKVGNNAHFSSDLSSTRNDTDFSAAVSSTPVLTEKEVTKEVDQDPTISIGTSRSASASAAPEVLQQEQEQQALGRKSSGKGGPGAINRWENHKKETCKCAVCMQRRGELKSSWYKHNQSNCCCAVCRQTRGESRIKVAHPVTVPGDGPLCGKHSAPSIPAKRASWLSPPESSVECWACSRELPRRGGRQQLQKPSPFSSSQQSMPFPSCNNVLNSTLAAPPVLPETCTMTGIPAVWQQKLTNLAGRPDSGIPSSSSSFLDPTPKCSFDVHQELPACEQRLGCSYNVEKFNADQQAFQMNFLSNLRCSGLANAEHTCSANFARNNSDGVQHCTSDCSNMRRSCGNHAPTSHNSTNLFWQKIMGRLQNIAGTSPGLHNAESPSFKKRLNLHSSEPIQETSSAYSTVTESNGLWSTNPNLCNMTKTERSAAGSLPDPFLSLGQSTSISGEHPSSMVHSQPVAASHSTTFPGMNFKPIYVPLQSSNPAHDLSGRSYSMDDFPFGLEVQAQAEHDMYQPVSDRQASIHTRSVSFNFDEGTMESSSPPCETTSTTSMVNERDNCSPVMDVDSGDILRSSGATPQRGPEELQPRTDVDVGGQARDEQLQSGCDNGARQAEPVGRKFSKRLANPDDSHFIVHQKRPKREGVCHSVPKWCHLVHSKYYHRTIIRKIYIRSRVLNKPPLSTVPEPSVRTDEKNGNAGTQTLTAQGDDLDSRSRFEEPTSSSNLQSTGPAGVKESTTVKGAPDEFIPARRDTLMVPEENIEEQRENMLNIKCSQESLNSKNCYETSPETEDSPRDKKIIKLNSYKKMPEPELQCTASVASPNVGSRPVEQCTGNIHDESEARVGEILPSLSESPDCTQDTRARKIRRLDICAIDDHLGKSVQLADPLIQDVVGKVCLGVRGRKRSRIGVDICSEERESRLNPLGSLIPELEDEHMLQTLQGRCVGRRYHGAALGTSVLCTDVEPSFKGRSTNFNSKTLRLTIEVLLPDSMKDYYLTRILKTTPTLSVWLIELVKRIAHKAPSSNIAAHSDSLVPKDHTSLCSTPRACSAPLYMLRILLKTYLHRKSTGLITWPKVFSGASNDCPRNIGDGKEASSENVNFSTRPSLDEELLSRFWYVRCTKNGFLLPHDRLTIYMQDILRHVPFHGMIKDSASTSSTLKKYCFYSILCAIGGTKYKEEKMAAFDQHQQSRTQEVKLFPLRNIPFPYWIDKPLHGSRLLIFPGVLFKRSPLRLLASSDAADRCITSGEQDRTAKSHCELETQCSTHENLEDGLSVERQCREQICRDGVMAEGYSSPPVNVVQTSLHNLKREQTPNSPAFHGEWTTDPRSVQMPRANSFQDLLKSVIQVDNNAFPSLSNNSESSTYPSEKLHQISSNECSRSIPDLNVWECHLDLRNDGPTTVPPTSSSDSIPRPLRKRGCPKGGWPKKNLSSPTADNDPADRDNKYLLRSVVRTLSSGGSAYWANGSKKRTRIRKIAAPVDLSPAPPVERDTTTSQHTAHVETELEVIQPTNSSSSKRRNSEFSVKLETFLDRPFQPQELEDLEGHAFLRKPLLRLRETRHRVLQVATKKKGMSYLDYHPDLARKVKEAAGPEERLRLLRGFFFWLQHSCTSGSFKPWAPDADEPEKIDDDCVEIPKEKFESQEHKIAPEAKATTYLRDQTSVAETNNTTSMTLRTRGLSTKSASQSTKSKHSPKIKKSSSEAMVKREKK